jgi:phenolic acid decarboxylase
MKRILGIALMMAFFSLPLLAGKNSQDFVLPGDVRIGDAQLPEGHCSVAWTQPTGSQVQLTIKTEGQKTITVPAHVVEGKQAGVAVQTFLANGVRYVSEFDTKNARFIVQEPTQGTK